jgi:hypothetical protein
MYGVKVSFAPQRYQSSSYLFLQIRCKVISNFRSGVVSKYRPYSGNVNQQVPSFEMESKYAMWKDVKNQRNFMNWAAEQLNIKEPSDWYTKSAKVSNKHAK